MSGHSKQGVMVHIHFIVQDVTSKTSCLEFIIFAKMMIHSKLGYSPFPISICVYSFTSKQTQHMENRRLMLDLHTFLRQPDQPKYAKLNFNFVYFFIAGSLYYHKIRLATLKPQLPIRSDNLKFHVVIGIWMQLQNH